MSFSVGIVGLPNVGKSSLFKALTTQPVEIANYPFATIDPNVGIVEVPDERLNSLRDIILPSVVTPTIVEVFDIAGLVRGASAGEGLGNEFLAHIQRVDAVVHLIRAFENPDVKHVEGAPDPERDYTIITEELRAKDKATLDTQREKIDKKATSGDREAQETLALFLEIAEAVETHKPPKRNEARREAQRLGILSVKPELVVLNVDETKTFDAAMPNALRLNIQQEVDGADLSNEEKAELGIKSHLKELIAATYTALNLITFFTIKGGKELRAWTIQNGAVAPEAGGIVHSDFQERFIRAEVLNAKDLIKADGWKAARQRGLIRIEGKEYAINDGDVIEFKI